MSCEFVHELHSKVESVALGVNLDLVKAMGVGNGEINEPPRQAWPPSPVLPCDGIIGHSLIHIVDSTSICVVVVDSRRDGYRLDFPRRVPTIDGRFLRWWVE